MQADGSGSQLGPILPPRDTGQRLETFLAVVTGSGGGGAGVLLAFSGWRPGTLLNVLLCTSQPPSTHTKNHPTQNVTVLKLRNLGLEKSLRLAVPQFFNS